MLNSWKNIDLVLDDRDYPKCIVFSTFELKHIPRIDNPE